MSTELISTLLQASGAAGVTLMFVVYLIKRDKRDSEMMGRFNTTVNGYLKDANKAQSTLAVKIHEFGQTNKELKDALEKIYIHNKSIVDENKRLRSQSIN